MPTLMESSGVQPVVFNTPKQVSSEASTLKKGRNWEIGVLGSVAIRSWLLADGAKQSDTITPFAPRLPLSKTPIDAGTERDQFAGIHDARWLNLKRDERLCDFQGHA